MVFSTDGKQSPKRRSIRVKVTKQWQGSEAVGGTVCQRASPRVWRLLTVSEHTWDKKSEDGSQFPTTYHSLLRSSLSHKANKSCLVWYVLRFNLAYLTLLYNSTSLFYHFIEFAK